VDGREKEHGYVSRGALKLLHALRDFGESTGLDVRGMVCADFGASTGGFTDCLLRNGAQRVYALDTAYGQLAWSLRNDPRVTVLERTNCLHAPVPPDAARDGGVHLVVADAGWTPQRLLVPAALRWMKPDARLITLIKPHYEVRDAREKLPPGGVLEEQEARRVVDRVVGLFPTFGARVLGLTRSPITGSAKGKGNAEWLALAQRVES
jgi:23S rRNA (cytidine1920-2'-O)/16S rRNA (cytidine1409-2'-O)-methyltransferase